MYAIWKGVSGQARVHGRWVELGGVAPPLEIGKKDAVRGNFNFFHLCFTKEIMWGGGRHTCKMEGGGRTGACPWWEGVVGERSCPPLENEKKEAVSGNFNLSSIFY